MNIKTIFVSTTLSILFGIYSIYGLINYLEKMDKLEKYYKDEIDYLKKQMTNINEKYHETNKKCNDLLVELNSTKDKIDTLSNNIIKIKTNKIELLDCHSDNPIYYDSSLEQIMEDNIICNAIVDIPKINLEVIKLCDNVIYDSDDNNNENYQDSDDTDDYKSPHNSILSTINDGINGVELDNLNKKFIEENEFEILEDDCSNNEHIIKSRSRGTSISDINWAAVTKKFIFG